MRRFWWWFQVYIAFSDEGLQAVQYFPEDGASHNFGILPSNPFITQTASYQKLRNIEPQRLVAYKKQNKIWEKKKLSILEYASSL